MSLWMVIQLSVTFLFYRIKRFKNGITLNNHDGSIESLLLISILSIFIFSISYSENAIQFPFEIILLTLIFCGLTFIFL